MQSLQRHAPQMKEIQKKYKQRQAEAERRADEVLPGEPDQPGRVVPADARAVPGLHRALLRAARTSRRSRRRCIPAASRSSTSSRRSPTTRRRTGAASCCSSSTSASQMASTLYMSATVDKMQRDDLHAHAARVRVRDRALPGRPRPLLGDDEPVDGRPGADHAPARAEDAGAASVEKKSSRTPPQDDGDGGGNGAKREPDAPKPAPARIAAAAAQGAPEEEGRRPAVSERRSTVEATGETVGEAKWAALRELELRHPGARQGGGAVRGRLPRASAACSASATSRRACSRICRPRLREAAALDESELRPTRAALVARSSPRSASTAASTCARTTTR